MDSVKNLLSAEISNKILRVYNSVYLIDFDKKTIEPYLYNNDVSRAMINMIGRGNSYELVFQDFASSFIIPEDKKEFLEITSLDNIQKQLDLKGEFEYTFRRYGLNYRLEYVEMKVFKLVNSDDNLAIATYRGVTESVNQINRKFENKAYEKRSFSELASLLSEVEYDELTGIYTKQAFMLHSKELIGANPDKVFSIIVIDLENYKLTNDQYGHAKCDELLRFIGNKLRDNITDGVVGRFGGDSFSMLISSEEEIDENWLRHNLTDLLRNAPIPHQNLKMGVYYNIDKMVPLSVCIERALWAVNKIKGNYEKFAFYSEKIREEFIEEQNIQESMFVALFEKQFEVYYQPKHDCNDKKITGAEALVRWNHPVYGFLSPAKFIPIFEKNGFITKLDTYVIERVCSDIKEWESKGIELVPISVNVSRRDFLEERCLEEQLEIINKYNVDSSLLHMEVTESFYVDNTEQIIKKVKMVQNNGYQIEMDDFGTGYSSLGMLTDFPLDVIKLDISFVRKLDKNEIVIDTIINLAHRMGFKIVAEGVETEKQYAKLKELDCDYIQGYFFSKPLPVNDFEEYILEKNYNI